MAGKIVLVTGGARSGKSSFAERYVASLGGRTAYIATAQAYDEEMRDRINRHRERRPSEWTTLEAPLDAEIIIGQCIYEYDTILFDCLTLYISNLFFLPNLKSAEERRTYILKTLEKLFDTAKRGTADLVFVTNEVGMGIVPENALAREYRDIAGQANQLAAAYADEVYFVICGLAVDIKKYAFRWDKEE